MKIDMQNLRVLLLLVLAVIILSCLLLKETRKEMFIIKTMKKEYNL